MNVLLVMPRFRKKVEKEYDVNFKYFFPLGLPYISAVLKQAGHHVDGLNLNHHKGTVDELIRDALGSEKKYDIVCTGGICIYYHEIKKVVDAVRSCEPEVKIILGGPLTTSEPELMFHTLQHDYVVIGEGEETVPELLSCIESGRNPEDVPGIGYRDKDGNFKRSKERDPIMHLDALPWPDFENFDYGTYLDNSLPRFNYHFGSSGRRYPVVTSRSCPFSCTFCSKTTKIYRKRSISSVMQELEFAVKRYRVEIIEIYDDMFSDNRERVVEFCGRIKRLIDEVPWECGWLCQMRVDKIDEELIEMMKDAGCFYIAYGFESYSETVLKSMKKCITPEQIDRAVHLTLKNNMSISANFIFGDPAETSQTALETLGYWKRLSNAGIRLAFIIPYPGSRIYNECVQRGIIKDKLDFIDNQMFEPINMSRTMTDREFNELKVDMTLAYERYSVNAVPLSLAGSGNGTYSISVRCPYCGEKVEYRNYPLPSRQHFNMRVYCLECRMRFSIKSRRALIQSKLSALFYAMLPAKMKYKMFGLLRKHSVARQTIGT